MSNILKELYEKKLSNLGGHRWIPDNTAYITQMGSTAYGVSNDNSDIDIYSFGFPRLEDLFPHLRGEIVGFGDAKHQNNRFKSFQEHHIKDIGDQKEYDICFYNIVDYFQLVMENNPNMIDSLFTPQSCVLHATKVGQMVRQNRKMFIHRGSYHTFKGYAYEQLKKAKPTDVLHCPKCDTSPFPLNSHNVHVPTELIDNKCFQCGTTAIIKKVNKKEGKRKASVDLYGYDPKFAYHIVRLLNEAEQILTEGDLDLQRNREQLKSIRRAEWTLPQIEEYFASKELQLEALYNENKAGLPWGPKDQGLQDRVKAFLFQCLEEHYGSIDKIVVNPDAATLALREVADVLEKYRKLI